MLLYMAQEGRGIGLLNKLKAYELQENGLDTVEANLELGLPIDAREYGIGSQILADLGLSTIRILTNNPKKLSGIEGFGLTVVEQVPIEVPPNAENRRYLEAKRDKLGHRLHHQDVKFESEERMTDRPARTSRTMSDRFEELRRSFEQDERQPYDHDQYEEASEDVLSALVEPARRRPSRAGAEPERGRRAEADEPEAARSRRSRPSRSPSPTPSRSTRPPGFRVPDGYATLEGTPNGSARSVGVVVSRFNGDITARMLAQALTALEEQGVARDAVTVVPVPGAFELPLAAMALAKTRRFACVVALGCVIRGETPHFEFIAGEAASGLQLAALETGVPVAFGVLTVRDVEQAEARIERGAEVARGGARDGRPLRPAARAGALSRPL